MSTTTENHPLHPNTFYAAPLETWADAIQRLSSDAEQCFLEKIEHYKALSDMEHEFLVVYASHPSGSKIVLGVDRNAQDPVTAACKQTSCSTSQTTDTTQPSTVASSMARYLNTLVCAKLSPLSSSARYLNTLVCAISQSLSSEEEVSSHLAYDGVQVSHDGTPAPILAQHGPCVPLYTIIFSSASPLTAPSSTSSTSSNSDARRLPSLLNLSVLLVTIRTSFPSYALLQYQCYFFARATCLALMDLFGGVVTDLEEGKRVATWRGVHVSQYSAGCTALMEMLSLFATPQFRKLLLPSTSPVLQRCQRMLPLLTTATLQKILLLVASPVLEKMLLLPLVSSTWLLVPAGLYTVYRSSKLYDGKVIESEVNRRQIRLNCLIFQSDM